MPWALLRRATDEDIERLDTTAARFITRHGIRRYDDSDPVTTVEWAVADHDDNKNWERKLRPLWRACVRRALRDRRAEGIAYDHIGYYVRD